MPDTLWTQGPDADTSAKFSLRVERRDCSGVVDYDIHMSVLKELLGQELVDLIRAELRSGLTHSLGDPGGLSCPEDQRALEEHEACGSLPQRRPTEICMRGQRSLLEETVVRVSHHHANRAEQPAQEEETDIFARVEEQPAQERQTTSSCQSAEANCRLHMSSDVGATAAYMHDIAMAKRFDAVVTGASSRGKAREIALAFPTFAGAILKFDDLIGSIGNVEAPDRSDCLSQIVESWWFKASMHLVTISFCVLQTYVADQDIQNPFSTSLGMLRHIDYIYLAIFTVELLLRIWRYRLYILVDKNFLMNWIDITIVAGGLCDVFSDVETGLNFQFLRAYRFLVVVRVLRALRIFKTLRTIIVSIESSLAELFWCTIMLVAVQFTFALFFVMRIGNHLRENRETMTAQQIDDLTTVFGSISSATLSLFQISTGAGDWSLHYDCLSPTGAINQVAYLFYVAFSFISFLNVILGIFVDHAMKNLQPTKEERAKEHAMDEMQVAVELKALCSEGDVCEPFGYLSRKEWDQLFAKGKISNYADLVGFRAHDMRAFFDLCSHQSKDGTVNIEEFVLGFMRLKGPASCFDVQTIVVELHELHNKIQAEVIQRIRAPEECHDARK